MCSRESAKLARSVSKTNRPRRPAWATLAAVLFAWGIGLGCSDDDASGNNGSVNNDAANNVTTNNATTNNSTSNNATTNNAATNNSTSNNATTNNSTPNNNTTTPIVGTETVLVPVGDASTGTLATSRNCVDCHGDDGISQAMLDSSGRTVAFYDLWSSSMKANAARDPFFHAVMSGETYRNPELAEEIEEKCLTCHAPLATVDADWADEDLTVEELTLPGARAELGADGVSCVACHAMTDEGFGTEDGFSGEFELNEEAELYGPHNSPFATPMENTSGFTPVASNHILESEQCATCHTLFTATIDDEANVLTEEVFPEQTPYLEWKNSDYAAGPGAATCQDCHVPTTDVDGNPIITEIARRPGGGLFPPTSARSPVGRHIFIGGNTLLPEIFKQYSDELNIMATDEAFDLTLQLTRDQLRNNTADLAISGASFANGTVSFDVEVTNRTGHKFPTAYPSRRAWLKVTVKDAGGNVLLESGEYDASGTILTAAGDPHPSEDHTQPLEPHYTQITDPDQVQIYQSAVGTTEGETTVFILSASQYLKDTRLLPLGWSDQHPDAGDTTPVGVDGDANFVAGGDTVSYALPVAGTPATVEVELLYQVIGARWANELFEMPTADVQRFKRMVEGVGGIATESVVTAEASL